MTPSTKPQAALTGIAVAAAALSMALVACADNGQGTSVTTATTPATTTGQAGSSQECSTGTYDVETVNGTQTLDLDGQQLTFSGAVTGLELKLEESTWELTGDDAKATVRVAGVAEVDATINGEASGSVNSSGDKYDFALERSSGSATVTLEGVGSKELQMDEVSTVLAPVGEATLNCTSDGATLETEAVTLELRRSGGATGTGTTGTGTTTTRSTETSGSSPTSTS